MTELQFGSRLLILVAAVGLVTVIVAGLALGWLVLPIQIANVNVFDLNTASQEDWIVLVANTYAVDHDLPRARERLAQIKDPQINDRIAALAKKSNAGNQPAAANLAALAAALGNTDQQIALIARTPTPTATLTPTPTETVPPATPTLTPTATTPPTRTATRRPVATATDPPTRTATRRPEATPTTSVTQTATRRPEATATATAKPAAIAPTNWLPFPGEWPPGANFVPANVAPGQNYWHLAKAIYCDQDDEHDYCQDMPGGPRGTETYVRFIGGGTSPISVTDNDGKTIAVEPKAAADICDCAYSFQSNGFNIIVAGAPSDKISGLSLYSVKAKLSNYHVRYFLWFQLLTK